MHPSFRDGFEKMAISNSTIAGAIESRWNKSPSKLRGRLSATSASHLKLLKDPNSGDLSRYKQTKELVQEAQNKWPKPSREVK